MTKEQPGQRARRRSFTGQRLDQTLHYLRWQLFRALEAAMYSFILLFPVDWFQEHLAAEAAHYLLPTLVQRLTHRPEVPLQWRCQQLLTVIGGQPEEMTSP
ncbi:hypothetical protein [Streptomyces sp. NBC_01789]|uniref:hypothetical protein n=1 Tax=Streptomyces sp. NBC_01789 TaxID=2975941 RepID=UPI00224DB099|nr:hypothetical protein [Streptomyces sp. NBC_01789]MCX4451752.1 hypothetical protein [Streptomyces sp. NBC_01789]